MSAIQSLTRYFFHNIVVNFKLLYYMKSENCCRKILPCIFQLLSYHLSMSRVSEDIIYGSSSVVCNNGQASWIFSSCGYTAPSAGIFHVTLPYQVFFHYAGIFHFSCDAFHCSCICISI